MSHREQHAMPRVNVCLRCAASVCAALVWPGQTAQAQGDDPAAWNHFGLDFWMGFNLKAKFTDPAMAVAPAAPSAGGAVNRSYSDGFVNVDASGNAGDRTWNWGYDHASQISGDTLLLHSSTFSPATGESHNDDPIPGFELTYARDLGHEKWGRWGIKAAFGYTQMNLRENGILNSSGRLITDAYPLYGVTPPVAPYSGSLNGPGTVIGSTPTRTVASGMAAITGNRSMDATLFDFRLGPVIDMQIVKRLSVEVSGGLAIGVVDSTFGFNETATSLSATVSSSGSTSSAGCLLGGYAEVGFDCRFWRAASVFAAAQFQDLGDFNQNVGAHTAKLDLSQSLFCALGLRFNF